MNRMINEDGLIKKLKEKSVVDGVNILSTTYTYKELVHIISNQPTAYDEEKVVAELEEMIKPKKFYFCKYVKGGCKHLDNDAKDCLECIVELSIDIVRKGRVE